MYYPHIHQPNGGEGYAGGGVNGGGSGFTFPEAPQISPWNHHSNREYEPFLLPATPQSIAGSLFNRRPYGLQFGSESGLFSDPFGIHAELQKLTAQEIMDAKALAASKAHSEAERKRRERINNHLAKLRSILPSTVKTDKASLLAEVIQHLKELKRQTCQIAENSEIPTETDELTVNNASNEEGKLLIKASICCEDRPDFIQDIIQTLKALKLKALKAEITAIGGRVKNVLFITEDEDEESVKGNEKEGEEQRHKYIINSIHEAFKAVIEKSNNGNESGSGSMKRQRTNISVLSRSL